MSKELFRSLIGMPPDQRRAELERELHQIIGVPLDLREPAGTIGTSAAVENRPAPPELPLPRANPTIEDDYFAQGSQPVSDAAGQDDYFAQSSVPVGDDGVIENLTDPQQYAEAAKGIPSGAVRMGGLALKGAAGANPIELMAGDVDRYREQFARVPDMSEDEIKSLVKDLRTKESRTTLNTLLPVISDLSNPNVPIEERRQILATRYPSATRLEDRTFYKAGETVSDFADTILPAEPGYETATGRQLGEGLGSLFAGIPVAVLGGPVGGGLFFGSAGMGESGERAVEFDRKEKAAGRPGLTNEQIDTAALLGIAPGSTDIIPVETLLGRIPLPIPPASKKPLAKAIGRIGGQAFIEGVQEFGQAFLQNLIAREVYDETQSLTEGTLPEAALGAGVGGIAQTGVEVGKGVLGRRGRGRSEQAPQPGETAPSAAPEQPESVVQPPPPPTDVAPVEPAPATEEVVPPEIRAVLRKQGYSTQDIKDMSLEELGAEAEDAVSQGVQVTAEEIAREEELATEPQEDLYSDGSQEVGGKGAPVVAESATDVDIANARVNTEPTEAQKEAGNYRKGHLKLHDLDITIENPKGSTRRGRDRDGNEWSVELPATYGYIKRTEGADGDQLDVYIGDEPESDRVYVVDQIEPETGKFDEHKAILGVRTVDEAQDLYEAGFSDGTGMQRLGAVTEMSIEEFRDFARSGRARKPLNYDETDGEGAIQVDEIKGTVGKLGAGIADGLYRRMWDRVLAGKTEDLGQGDVFLQAGKLVRDAGGAQTYEDFKKFVQELDAAIDGKTGAEYQTAAKAVMRSHIPASEEVDLPASEEPDQFDAAFDAGLDQAFSNRPAPVEERDPVKQMNVRRQGTRKTPMGLTEFLARNGGIRDDGGELAALDLTNKFVPGAGKLVRKGGLSPDDARALAVEHGYIGAQDRASPERQATSTPTDLFDALDRESRGETIYSLDDRDRVEELGNQAAEEAIRDEAEARFGSLEEAEAQGAMPDALQSFLAEYQMQTSDFDADVLARAQPLIEDGMDPGDALERASIEIEESDGVAQDIPVDISSPDEVSDETVEPRPSETGRTTAADERAGDRSEEVQETSGPEPEPEQPVDARPADRGEEPSQDLEQQPPEKTDPTKPPAGVRPEGIPEVRKPEYVLTDESSSFEEELNLPYSEEFIGLPHNDWRRVSNSTLKHYAKGYDVETLGRTRADIIDDMETAGAKVRQSGHIISSEHSTEEAIELLKNAGYAEGSKVSEGIFNKFKAALRAHPEKVHGDFQHSWRIGDRYQSKDGYQLRFSSYGKTGVVITSGDPPGLSGGYVGSTLSRTNAAKIMKAFIADNPPPKDWKNADSKAKKPVATRSQKPTTSSIGADRLSDPGDEPITGYEGEDGARKKDFLNNARSYLAKTAKKLAQDGFVPYLDNKGKKTKPVSVNKAGPAVAGEVSLNLDHPDGTGIYVQVGHGVLKPGLSVLVRTTSATDRYGAKSQNNWWPSDLSTQDLADRLKTLAAQPPNTRPAKAAPTDRDKFVGDFKNALEGWRRVQGPNGALYAHRALGGGDIAVAKWATGTARKITSITAPTGEKWSLDQAAEKAADDAGFDPAPVTDQGMNRLAAERERARARPTEPLDTGTTPEPATQEGARLADFLTKKHSDVLATILESDRSEASDVLGNIDRELRTVIAFNRRSGESLQANSAIEEGVAAARAILDAAGNQPFADIQGPSRDDATGEFDYDTGHPAMAEAQQWLDLLPAQGFPVDQITGQPRGPRDDTVEPMPDEAVFPPPTRVESVANQLKNGPFVPQEDADRLKDEWKAIATRVGQMNDNGDKVIFSLFDYTGQWSKPWTDAGFNVVTIDIKTGEDLVTNDWIWDRINEVREEGYEVYGVLSACPCTTFSGAGSRWWAERHDKENRAQLEKVFGDRALASGAKSPLEYNVMLVDATREFTRQANPSAFHVLENPIGRIQSVAKMPRPTMRFHPNNYGDPYTKQTNLFGEIKTDLPTANVEPTEGSKVQSKLRGDRPADKEARSTTPEGFAYSFFMANAPQDQVAAARNALAEGGSPTPDPLPTDLTKSAGEVWNEHTPAGRADFLRVATGKDFTKGGGQGPHFQNWEGLPPQFKEPVEAYLNKGQTSSSSGDAPDDEGLPDLPAFLDRKKTPRETAPVEPTATEPKLTTVQQEAEDARERFDAYLAERKAVNGVRLVLNLSPGAAEVLQSQAVRDGRLIKTKRGYRYKPKGYDERIKKLKAAAAARRGEKPAPEPYADLKSEEVKGLFDALPHDIDAWDDLRVEILEARPDLIDAVAKVLGSENLPPRPPVMSPERRKALNAARREKGQRIKAYVEAGGTVRLHTAHKVWFYGDPEMIDVRSDGPYFQSGKSWNAATDPQIDAMLHFIRSAPVTEEQTDAGKQTVLPGAEKISDKELAERNANQKLKPKAKQKEPDFGLFSTERDQGDLVELTKEPTAPAQQSGNIRNRIQQALDANDRTAFVEATKKQAPEKVASILARIIDKADWKRAKSARNFGTDVIADKARDLRRDADKLFETGKQRKRGGAIRKRKLNAEDQAKHDALLVRAEKITTEMETVASNATAIVNKALDDAFSSAAVRPGDTARLTGNFSLHTGHEISDVIGTVHRSEPSGTAQLHDRATAEVLMLDPDDIARLEPATEEEASWGRFAPVVGSDSQEGRQWFAEQVNKLLRGDEPLLVIPFQEGWGVSIGNADNQVAVLIGTNRIREDVPGLFAAWVPDYLGMTNDERVEFARAFEERSQPTSESDFDAGFDAGLDEAFAPDDQAPRTKTEVATSATENLAESADAAMAGLVELFGGGKTLGSGPAFDPDTYERAKPLFIQAATKFADFKNDVAELVKRMVVDMVQAHGLTREGMEAMRPYLRRFVGDVESGIINLDTIKDKDDAERQDLREDAPEVSGEQPSDGASATGSEPGVDPLPVGSGPAGRGDVRDGPVSDGGGEQRDGLPQESRSDAADPGDRRGTGTQASDLQRDVDETLKKRSQLNYRITAEDKIGEGGPKARVRANIEAIRTLKLIEDERRQATPEEQAVLVKYVGWGAFAQDVFAHHKAEWKKERTQLQDLLSAEEIASAKASTLNAHYTSREVIDGIWDAVQHLGFTGGRALEPSAGVGHFIGLTPGKILTDTSWSAVELDSITGRIAKQLYQGADVNVQGFETFNRPADFYDLAISNVPFGNYKVPDRKYPPALIHDYFFMKSLDKVRPGGIVAFVTSSGTLDKKDQSARKAIAKRGHFLGAIRLPGGKKGAFSGNAGTEVTTDIIFMRASEPGTALQQDRTWIGTTEIKTPEGLATINRYFAENPQMMLGRMRLTGTQYTDGQPVLIGSTANIREKIATAAQNLPDDAFLPRGSSREGVIEDDTFVEAGETKEGAYFTENGKLYRKVFGIGQEQKKASKVDRDRITRLIKVRDAMNELLVKQAVGDRDGLEALRKRLSQSYDAFVKKHGPISRTTVTTSKKLRADGQPVITRRMPNFSAFKVDPDAYKVLALENYDLESDTATKAAIFTEDIVSPAPKPQISTEVDALSVSLNLHGKVYIPFIAQSLNISNAEAIDRLGSRIFLDPEGDKWTTAEQYLSGDVVSKLEDARAAAQADPQAYTRNVEALTEVQPDPLTRVDIRVPLGGPWVPADVFEQFLREEADATANIKVSLNPGTKRWRVIEGGFGRAGQSKYGHDRMAIADMVEHALNQTPVTITTKTRDGVVVDHVATQEVRARMAALREAFGGNPELGTDGWVWRDEERAARLEVTYNRSFNRLVTTKYDGSHLTFPGLAKTLTLSDGTKVPFSLRQHQKDAVWRTIQSGNTLLDHVVGAGKTFTMIASGMEQKRLGLIQRPIYVVPNHMLEQFSREFLQAYPSASIMVADKDSMSLAKRKEMAARIAAQKWDGIIITHDAFSRLRMSETAYTDYVKDEIEQMEEMKNAAAAEEGKASPTVKDMERAKKALETRLEKLVNTERKDAGVTFEELGVDMIFLDEAHLFKNLSFATRHTRVKGVGQGDAQRATDLFLKIRHLESQRPGRSSIFATGTPLSNTMAEIYTMQRYQQFERLKEYGIEQFDAWAGTFGEIVSQMELAPDGRSFRETSSFSKFINIPELIAIYSEFADTQTAEMLNLPRPKLVGGAPIIVEAEPSPYEEAIIASLVKRAQGPFGKQEKGADNMLKVVTEGRKVAIDGRLLNPDAPFNPNGTVAKAVRNIYRIWKQGKAPALVQMVFLDMGVPTTRARKKKTAEELSVGPDETDALAARFNLYEEIRTQLVDAGIPREQVAFIHEATDDAKKALMFQKVRSGEIRVLIGSTSKMGVGTNVQDQLYAMHHLDAPWKPAEVEQRDGRIVRQGNLNDEVEMYRYLTKRSFSAFMWQTLERKAKFIGQIKAGARGVRSAEDIDDPLPEAAQLKAAASGDPRIMEHAELNKEVRDLEVAKRAHERTSISAKRQLKETRDEIEYRRNVDANQAPDLDLVTDVSGDKFTVTLDVPAKGKAFKSRKKAGTAIRDFISQQSSTIWGSEPRKMEVGTMSGFRMGFMVQRTSDGIQVAPFLGTDTNRYNSSGGWVFFTEDSDPVGIVRRFENILNDVPKAILENREKIPALEREIAPLEKQAAGSAFPKQAQLEKQALRLKVLTEELREKTRKEQEQAAKGSETPDLGSLQEAGQTQTVGRTMAQIDALENEIRTLADTILGHHLNRLEIGTGTFGDQRYFGFFNPEHRLLAVSLDAADPRATLRHEAIHALRDAGVFTEREWTILGRTASNRWMDEYNIHDTYAHYADQFPGLMPAEIEDLYREEAVAQAFQSYRDGNYRPAPLVRRIFDRLLRFLEAVANAARGEGFQTYEDIFEAIERGDVSRREPGSGAPRAADLVKGAKLGSARLTPRAVAALDDIAADVTEIVQRIAPNAEVVRAGSLDSFTADLVERSGGLSGQPASGAYVQRAGLEPLIILAMNENSDPRNEAGHEAWHALELGNLMSGQEQAILLREQPRLRAIAAAELGIDVDSDRMRKVPDYEVNAIAFARYRRLIEDDHPVSGYHIGLRRIFNRIAGMLRQIRNAVQGLGFATTEDIFEMARQGDIGRRPAQETATEPITSLSMTKIVTRDRVERTMARAGDLADAARIRVQDRFLPWKRLQEQLERETGTKISTSFDTYMAESLYHGRTGERLIDVQDKFLEPLIEMLRDADLTIEEVGDYLYARHAKERNDQIATINPALPEGGSGMTDLEAEMILNAVEDSDKRGDYDAAARLVDDMLRESRQTLLSAGLIDKATFDNWTKAYENYVPLRGFELSADEDPDRPRSGLGFDIRGPEAYQALGRRSKADNPIIYAAMQAQEAIVRAEKNRVLKTVMRSIQAHPIPSVWSIHKGTTDRRINPETGLVETTFIPPGFAPTEDLFRVKIGGHAKWIQIKHPALARALRGSGAIDMQGSILGRGILKVARFYAGLVTQWSPEFIVSNYARDIETAVINAADVEGLPKGARLKIIKEAASLKSIRGIVSALRGSGESEYAPWFDEYRLAGGKISFIETNDVDRIRARIQSSLKAGRVRRGLRDIAKVVEDLNSAVENGVRLSTYVSMRKAGISKDVAASAARELTVNFNRKGELGPALNAAYLFFNASIQGSTRIAQAFQRSKAVRLAVGGIFAAGMSMEVLNYILAGEDDDGENAYDKIPEWEKERNIIVMIPGDPDHGYIKWPLAWGYNVPYLAGQQLMASIRGQRKPLEAAGTIGAALFASFNPIGSAPSFQQFITPTLLDPSVQVGENLSWFGGKIAPTKFDPRKPESENFFASAPFWAVDLARTLNEATGGNVGSSGWFDVSPETIEHYVDFIGGGVSKFVSNAVNTGERVINGEEWLPEKTPFLRRLYGKATATSRRREFYEAWDEVDRALYEIKRLQKAGEREEAAQKRQEYRPELRAHKALKNARKALTTLRKRRNLIEQDRSITDVQRRERLDQLVKRENGIILRAMATYNRAKKKNAKAAAVTE